MGRIRLAIPAAAAVLTVAVMLYQAGGVEPTLTEEHFVRLGELPGFRSEKIETSEAELKTLPKDTFIDRRRYVADSGEWLVVSLVVGGSSKSSLHRPEICLPSQGNRMSEPKTIDAAGISWRAMKLEHGQDASVGFAYTFYNQAGYRTSSHVARIFRDVLDRSFGGRIDRWAMLTVVSPFTAGRGLERQLALLEAVVK